MKVRPQCRNKERASLLYLCLWRLQLGLQQLSHVFCSVHQIVSELLSSQLLRDDVELQGVLVDHVGNTEAFVNNLRPSVAVEPLRGKLGGGQVPARRVGIGGILENLGNFFALLEELFKAKQVPIDTMTLGSIRNVFYVSCNCGSEQLDTLGSLFYTHVSNRTSTLQGEIHTSTSGSCIALHQATLSSETVRQVSVRPNWNLRVAADS